MGLFQPQDAQEFRAGYPDFRGSGASFAALRRPSPEGAPLYDLGYNWATRGAPLYPLGGRT